MDGIASSLGKSTEKIRTWYNNRRALDRKLGNHVIRNGMGTPISTPVSAALPPAASLSCPDDDDQARSQELKTPRRPTLNMTGTSHQSETLVGQALFRQSETVLQSNTPSQVNVRTPQLSFRPLSAGHYRGSTSTSTGWVAASPDHDFFHAHPSHSPSTPLSPAFGLSSSRFRIAPLRIRQVRLGIGKTTLHGEIPHDLPLDQGLEVKFLFGKKRIVYEWYCGQDYSRSQETGGPYAKMEMMFSTIVKFRMVQGPATTTINLALSQDPSLYLQKEESINKFKQRAQQRQYRKVQQDEFPIPVMREKHVIFMKTDEAVRVCNVLLEDFPQLMNIFESVMDNAFQSARQSPAVLPRLPEARALFPGTSPFPSVGMQRTSPVIPPDLPVLHRAPPAARASSTEAHMDIDINPSEPRQGVTRTVSEWQSPVSGGKKTCSRNQPDAKRSANSDIVADSGNSQEVSSPAISRNDDDLGCDQGPKTVRRELNFSHLHVTSPRLVGVKRRFDSATYSGRMEGRQRLRRRLSNEAEPPRVGERSITASERGHSAVFPTKEETVKVASQEVLGASGSAEQRSESSKAETTSGKGSSVIRRLPR